jgi:hypothetical protein
MEKDTIAGDVRRFILTSVPSVPYLEALRLLRAEASTRWGAPRLARRLYVADAAARALLEQLEQGGVAVRVGNDEYEYRPASELDALLGRVDAAYAADLVGIAELIHSRMEKRAEFADAFVFKKPGG